MECVFFCSPFSSQLSCDGFLDPMSDLPSSLIPDNVDDYTTKEYWGHGALGTDLFLLPRTGTLDLFVHVLITLITVDGHKDGQ